MPTVRVIIEVEGGLTARDVRIEEEVLVYRRVETLSAIKEATRQATNAALAAAQA